MIIKSIELENIRSYEKQKIEFDLGINFLSGDIGSGKSSILQAIEFALFGFKRGDLEGFHLIRKGKNNASVKLVLLNNKNQEIEIFRKIKKGKTKDNISQENGYVKIDNNLIELSAQEINSQVFEILNFPQEFLTKDKNLIYRFTIYTPQEQLKEVLFSENEKRLEIIRKIFQIDKYKKIKDAISIYSSKIKEDKKIFQVKIEPKKELNNKKEELNEQLLLNKEKEEKLKVKEEQLKERFQKYENALLKKEDILEKLNSNILIIEKKLSQLDEIENSNLKLENDKKRLEQFLEKYSKSQIEKDINNLENNIKLKQEQILDIEKEDIYIKNKLTEFDENIKEKDRLEQRYNEYKSKLDIFNFQKDSFDYILTKCQLKDLQNEILKIKATLKKKDKLDIDIKEDEQKLLKIGLECENLKEKIEENQTKLKQINQLNNCPNCLQEVTLKHREDISKKLRLDIKNIEDKLRQKLIENKNIKNELENKKKEFEKYLEDQRELFKKEEKYNIILEKEKEERKKYYELKKLKKEVEDLEKLDLLKKIEIFNEKLKEYSKINQKQEEIKNKKIKINNEISNIKIEINNLKNNLNDYEKSKKDIEILIKNINDNLLKLNKKKEYKDRLKQLKEKQNLVKEYINKIKKVVEKYRQKDKLISNSLSSYKTQIENILKEQLEIEQKLKKIEIEENLYIKLLKKENVLINKLVKITEIIEMKLFTKYYVEFNEEFEKLFKELIEDNEIEVRLNEEFSPIVEQNGYDINISNLSGGEKSSLAVAYRLGLKKIIEDNLSNKQKLSLLILDEPTDGFSNEQIDRLGNILKQTQLRQIILVSHDQQIESISDRVLNVEKINHISTINVKTTNI